MQNEAARVFALQLARHEALLPTAVGYSQNIHNRVAGDVIQCVTFSTLLCDARWLMLTAKHRLVEINKIKYMFFSGYRNHVLHLREHQLLLPHMLPICWLVVKGFDASLDFPYRIHSWTLWPKKGDSGLDSSLGQQGAAHQSLSCFMISNLQCHIVPAFSLRKASRESKRAVPN